MNFEHFVFQSENWSPQNLFFHLSESPYGVLLESGRLHPATGRYSILGLQPKRIFQSFGISCELQEGDRTRRWQGNPMTFLEEEIGRWPAASIDPTWPPFVGGAIGFFGYPALRWTEPISLQSKPSLRLPDLLFLFFDWAVLFDHLNDKVIFIGKSEARQEMQRAAASLSMLPQLPLAAPTVSSADSERRWRSNFTRQQFFQAVEKAKEYIRCGDIFQANLSQRLTSQTSVDGKTLYETLTELNPSPFAAYLKTPSFELISCSPERLFRLKEGVAETRPIAGTRPRAKERFEDEALARELLINEKERAEHIMLLDLERNDLGKVCRYGSVEVNEFLAVENYSHVRHLVSNVRGRLERGKTGLDLLRALFPGGTITGTPKVRSMQIIDQLETVGRDLYTGSLGYFSYTQNADFNILIRTLVKQGARLSLSVGAGIVADSSPEKEYEETWHKARALTQAVVEAESRKQNGSYSLS